MFVTPGKYNTLSTKFSTVNEYTNSEEFLSKPQITFLVKPKEGYICLQFKSLESTGSCDYHDDKLTKNNEDDKSMTNFKDSEFVSPNESKL